MSYWPGWRRKQNDLRIRLEFSSDGDEQYSLYRKIQEAL
jgi:hypothetical protein